jgi:hypothetical protein
MRRKLRPVAPNPICLVSARWTGRKAALRLEKEMPGSFLFDMSGTRMILRWNEMNRLRASDRV